MKRTLLIARWLLVILAVAILAAILFINYLAQSAKLFTYYRVGDVPAAPVGIVFGALVNPDHTLSPILQDRVDGGIALYQAGKVSHLLMTGDNSSTHYDEVTAMADYAQAHGVPASAITLDYAGFDTHDSCYRAGAIFGVKKAVLVTQKYHLPRALYLCRSMGMDATGLALDDFSKWPDLRFNYTSREYAADFKALWQVSLHSKPKYLGPQVSIN